MNSTQSEKFGFLMERMSSIYFDVKLNNLASCIFLFYLESQGTNTYMNI